MSAQSPRLALPLCGIRRDLNRRASLAAFFGNSALMASTTAELPMLTTGHFR
jgi:hypothetical protein